MFMRCLCAGLAAPERGANSVQAVYNTLVISVAERSSFDLGLEMSDRACSGWSQLQFQLQPIFKMQIQIPFAAIMNADHIDERIQNNQST
jgi:hypothetical protein